MRTRRDRTRKAIVDQDLGIQIELPKEMMLDTSSGLKVCERFGFGGQFGL